MTEIPYLQKFVPENHSGLEINYSLETVVRRLATYLPNEVICELFTSTPNETGGISRFPYSRVDNNLVVCSRWIEIFEDYGPRDTADFNRIYNHASQAAFEALMWVEVGFEGIDNLAISPASKNWTTAVGHFVNDEERAEGIKTSGKELYQEVLGKYVHFRDANRIEGDIFILYGADELLERFRVA